MANDALDFDFRQFDTAFAELAKGSTRADHELVTLNGKDVLRSIVYNTPRDTGAARAGWEPAWQGLGLPGKPGSRRSAGQTFLRGRAKTGRDYTPEGGFEDGRTTAVPFVEFTNRTHFRGRKDGKRVDYIFILASKVPFMRQAEAEVGRKLEKRLERRYRKLLRAASAGRA